MTKRDSEVKAQGRVLAERRKGNVKVVQVALIGEEQRGPREVHVHAMAGDISAIKSALAQRAAEQGRLTENRLW